MEFRKLSNIYKSIALLFFNALLLLVCINILLYIFYEIKDNIWNKQASHKKDKIEKLKVAYPYLNEEQTEKLFTETWDTPRKGQSLTDFKEKEFKGEYVNIHNAGFRYCIDQGPWPIDSHNFNIFIFGGSTTFGYGVTDTETIASHLQKILNDSIQNKKIKCYNFGSRICYSVKERMLFEDLILNKHLPDIAIFIDGPNDFSYEERSSAAQENKYAGRKSSSHLVKWIKTLPLSRLVSSINHKFFNKKSEYHHPQNNCDAKHLRNVIERYFSNKKIIEGTADAFGIQTHFFWQPVSSYKYKRNEKLISKTGKDEYFPKCGYEMMDKYKEKTVYTGNNFYWLAEIQKDKREPLYIDGRHYSAAMNAMIAKEIFISLKNKISFKLLLKTNPLLRFFRNHQ